MGQDKALLPFGEYSTLSEYQHHRLKQLFDKVYISTKEQKFGFSPDLIFDIYPESSPLVGLISIFDTIEEDECFILSVDAPFVDIDVIDALYDASRDSTLDAIIAQSPAGRQPLCGIYRESIIPIAKTFIAENNHKLNTLLIASKSHFVLFEDEKPFGNLNYPHEYEAALKNTKSPIDS